MRFRFCGDLDCPDWVLAEISILSRMSSVKMKLFCIQVLNHILGNEMNYEKVYKLTSDAKFDSNDVRASIAALSFILTSAAKYGIEEDTLSNELQQLGLPKEHSVSLCKAYADKFIPLQDRLKRDSLRLSRFKKLRWRVDYVIASNHLDEINEPTVGVCIEETNVGGRSRQHSLSMSSDKLRVLLSELKEAARIMDSVS